MTLKVLPSAQLNAAEELLVSDHTKVHQGDTADSLK